MTFEKILVANRGEIACRVIRTAKAMGYRTVAVFSEADRAAAHVAMADEAVCIGPAPVGQSYLNVSAILAAAASTGADAVHPGYGFLSENADFARACEDAGITFVGPPVEAIHLMGSKRLSKIAMQEAGVPCIPGYEGAAQDDETLLKEAKRVGLPLMIKASAGGGGRGMRVVTDAGQIPEQLRSARAEAKSAFGSDELILERAVIRPRHVEIQVFGDRHGNVVHLGERDCSVQRRHQKVVEEAPSPAVTPRLRAAMGEAAVNAAKACNYVGAGTVEFLLDPEGNFYFLEMNTRLQVEHPVTELVTGQDLVAWQIKVARGEPLPLTQDEITLSGHAMEVRLYAEDPGAGFLPQTGPVLRWLPACGDGVRIDHGLREGYEVGSHYDPMLAKIIAYGATREDARRRLIRAIEDSVLLGVGDNRKFLAAILRHPAFASGDATTAFIGEEFSSHSSMQPRVTPSDAWMVAAALFHARHHTSNWRSSPGTGQPLTLQCAEEKAVLTIRRSDTGLHVTRETEEAEVQLETHGDTAVLVLNGIRREIHYCFHQQHLYFGWLGDAFSFEDQTHLPPIVGAGAGSGRIRAPMDGAVMTVLAEVGQTVKSGDTLVLLEAMKIEHSLKSDVDGIVESVTAQPGDQVKGKQVLVVIAPTENQEA